MSPARRQILRCMGVLRPLAASDQLCKSAGFVIRFLQRAIGIAVFFVAKIRSLADKDGDMKQVKKAEIMDEGAVRRAINRISYEIIEKNHGSEDIVLAGVCTRGVYLAERMADKISEVEGSRPQTLPLDITAYRDDLPSRESVTFPALEITDIERKTVVIVDDVLFTGRTARAAMEAVLSAGRAKCIQLAVLVDRGHRELPIRPDYIGKNLPTSHEERVRVQLREVDDRDSVVILEDKRERQGLKD